MHRLSCSAACRIFPDQGSNPCLLHWQTNSLPWATREALDHFLLKCRACVLDIIGICKNYEDVTKIIVKSNNREVSKRNIYLMDISGKVVNATLWGDDVSARIEWRECMQKGGDTKLPGWWSCLWSCGVLAMLAEWTLPRERLGSLGNIWKPLGFTSVRFAVI